MTRRRLTLALSWTFVVATASCGSPADLGPFTIDYALDVESGGCASAQCEAFGMSCGAVLSIRLTDADTGEVINPGRPASLCTTVAPSASLCGLSNIGPGQIFFDLPPDVLRIEVAAWSPETLEAAGYGPGECPDEDIFDLTGKPLFGYSPQPAFAGATYFDAGSPATQAVVSLSCSDPAQLAALTCEPDDVTVRAGVFDIESPQTPADLPELLVRAAAVRQGLDGEDVFTEIDTSMPLIVLEKSSPDGNYEASLDELSVPNPLCVVVLEQTPQATSSVLCGSSQSPPPIQVAGSLMRKPVLDQMLGAIDLEDFPTEGLVIGRILDLAGNPISGAAVVPNEAPLATVGYLSSSRDDTLGDRTFDNGYFIAQGVPFGTQWTVTAPGVEPVSVPIAGVVRNQLTLLPIRMRIREDI